MGLTSNQISSLGTIVSTNRDIKPQESLPTTTLPLSAHESNKTVSSINNDDEVETVNEVLGMEERNGKIYYKVNFTGHSSDYTAWAVRAQIDPLADEINRTVEKIQGLIIDHLTKTPRAQLDQWKAGMHQLVDDIYFEKSQEMDTLIEQNKEEFADHKKQHLEMIMKIQDDVKQLVEDGDATFEQVQLVKAQLINVEKAMGLFQENFICINAQISGRDLLKVRSNLNKLQVIRAKSSVQKPASSNPISDVNGHANKKINERPHAAQAPSSPFCGGVGCSPLGNPKPTLFSPTTSTATASPQIFGFGAPAVGVFTSAPFGSASTTTTSLFSFAAPTVQASTSGSSFGSQPSFTPTLAVSTFGNKDVTIKANPRRQKN
ncbi:unnamed protein product [Rotaria magnacalcarata]|uniref:Uncharacterized protein n=2 Tax=Rotaria magnacalcarata TaxID=392030 RepID=A0A816WF23_9BILA|nr:unnamed protein product [Rotaria magnacalcarata]